MAVFIDVDMRPPPAVAAADFAAIGIAIRSYHEPLKRAIQGVVAPSIRMNFDVGGRPRWASLAESTLKKKAEKGHGSRTLIATGILQRVAGQLNIWTIGREEAHITDLRGAPYGVFHQIGTSKMLERPWAVIQPQDEDDIERVFAYWLAQRFAARGFVSTAVASML